MFKIELFEFLKDTLLETRTARTQIHRDQSNPTLSAPLFSASVNKNRLFGKSSSTYAFAREGLQLPGPDGDEEPEKKEVLALGACDDDGTMARHE